MNHTTRRLLLLRHAKAVRAAGSAGAADAARALTERGEIDAAAVGEWLRAAAVSPDLVLCSPARRARQTWDLAAGRLATTPTISREERIYQADDVELLRLLRETDDAVETLLLVGHNPAVHRTAFMLTEAAEVREDFPSGALAVVSVPGTWAGVVPGGATLDVFVRP